MAGVIPVEIAARRRCDEEEESDHEPKRMPAQKPAAGLIAAFIGLTFPRGRHLHDAALARG
jgi:hypothetical protein